MYILKRYMYLLMKTEILHLQVLQNHEEMLDIWIRKTSQLRGNPRWTANSFYRQHRWRRILLLAEWTLRQPKVKNIQLGRFYGTCSSDRSLRQSLYFKCLNIQFCFVQVAHFYSQNDLDNNRKKINLFNFSA